MTCQYCGRPKGIDYFSGEGGAGEGYYRAGFCMDAVDTVQARLDRYPRHCRGQARTRGDALQHCLLFGRTYAFAHASPTCTGYSAGTRAIPNRVAKYDRLIAAMREALELTGRPYVIENVEGAKKELRTPILLCGRMFDLSATDDDGTPLVMDRHRLFESNVFLIQPEHAKHDRSLQVAVEDRTTGDKPMSDATKRTRSKTWNEYVLQLPTNATEVSKAIQWAVSDIEGDYWDDSIEVIAEDDELLILRVETNQ